MKWKRRPTAYEEVEYEPLTVLEILTEMKDLSELMTSLAYSALVLDSDPIGEEVEALAQRMDWLKYQLRLSASMGVRTKEEAEQVAGILQVGDASEHIANAASDMVELLDANVELRPFLGRVLEEADDRVGTIKVPSGSRAIGQTLGGLRLESNTGVRVIAIRRGRRWVYDPGPDAAFQADDTLLVRGQLEGSQHLQRWLAGKEDEL
jgi:uncharacterized protein with PhoU and TrkA domain